MVFPQDDSMSTHGVFTAKPNLNASRFEDDSCCESDHVQDTDEGDKPGFRESDLRKSLTASQRDSNLASHNQASDMRPSNLFSSTKSAQAGLPELSPFEINLKSAKDLHL